VIFLSFSSFCFLSFFFLFGYEKRKKIIVYCCFMCLPLNKIDTFFSIDKLHTHLVVLNL
jgi:cellulose synthase/poly-beta-1,6-N-acetylglucosamine synthase-like glycosyltransferase